LIAAGERIERGGSGIAIRRIASVLGRRRRRNLDCRQANFTPVLKYEGAAVDDAADYAAADLATTARLLLFCRARRRGTARCGHASRKHGCQQAVQDPVHGSIPPNRYTVKRKAGMRRYCYRALTPARHKPCRRTGIRPIGHATPIPPR
jgi:hypothetical protein